MTWESASVGCAKKKKKLSNWTWIEARQLSQGTGPWKLLSMILLVLIASSDQTTPRDQSLHFGRMCCCMGAVSPTNTASLKSAKHQKGGAPISLLRGSEVCLLPGNAHDHGGHSYWSGFKAVMGERMCSRLWKKCPSSQASGFCLFFEFIFHFISFPVQGFKVDAECTTGSMLLRSVHKATEFNTERGYAVFVCGNSAICTLLPSPAMRWWVKETQKMQA